MKNKKDKKKLNEVLDSVQKNTVLEILPTTAPINPTKDNLWFKNKTYGYGWTPASRNGWIVILIFVTFLLLQVVDLVNKLEAGMNSTLSVLFYIFNLALALITFWTVAILKGEKPRWSWKTKK
jgi:hypothetical protein